MCLQKIIVITGAESTGKSSLTQFLATHYQAPHIPEIAREYVENLQRKYTYNDVETIAKMQVREMNKFAHSTAPHLFVDTWLIVTKIWFEQVFKQTPAWLEQEIINTRVHLFLVCDIDLPWVPDPVRENGGEMRNILHQKYIETLQHYQFNYRIVHGKGAARNQNALRKIREME